MVGGDAGTGAVRAHPDDGFFVFGESIVAAAAGGQPVSERYLFIQGPRLGPFGYEVLFEWLVQL